jgi:hypothetical protein
VGVFCRQAKRLMPGAHHVGRCSTADNEHRALTRPLCDCGPNDLDEVRQIEQTPADLEDDNWESS